MGRRFQGSKPDGRDSVRSVGRSPRARRRHAGTQEISLAESQNDTDLQPQSILLIFRIWSLGNRHPAITSDASADAYVLAFSCSPMPTPMQYSSNHRFPRMILVCFGGTAYSIPVVFVRHCVQAWTKKLIHNLRRNVVSSAMMRHLKVSNTWQCESSNRRVVDYLLQRFTPSIASKQDAVAVYTTLISFSRLVGSGGKYSSPHRDFI